MIKFKVIYSPLGYEVNAKEVASDCRLPESSCYDSYFEISKGMLFLVHRDRYQYHRVMLDCDIYHVVFLDEKKPQN